MTWGRGVVDEQIAYWARAGEYDEWFFRKGRYDRGEQWNRLWFDEVETLRREVESLPRCETALELACGTGIWTERLCCIGGRVTAIDASPEVIEINRGKLPGAAVNYRQEDLFLWEPEAQYDLVFCSFWLSHIPPEELDGFLAKIRRAAKPGGTVFVIDSLPDDASSAADAEPKDSSRTVEHRKLNDGRQFQVVKVYYQPRELEAMFARHGLRAQAALTGRFFWFLRAVPLHNMRET